MNTKHIAIVATVVIAAGTIAYAFRSKIQPMLSKVPVLSQLSMGGSSTPAQSTQVIQNQQAQGITHASTPGLVTSQSSSSAILAAFDEVGYIAALTAEGDTQYVADATSDPSSWLLSHQYLVEDYPSVFGPG